VVVFIVNTPIEPIPIVSHDPIRVISGAGWQWRPWLSRILELPKFGDNFSTPRILRYRTRKSHEDTFWQTWATLATPWRVLLDRSSHNGHICRSCWDPRSSASRFPLSCRICLSEIWHLILYCFRKSGTRSRRPSAKSTLLRRYRW